MKAALWKRRFSLLIALFALCTFAAEALAQSQCLGDKRRRYKVKIESSPPGAAIYIGQESCGTIGTTPWEGRLPKGTWKIILKKDGHELKEHVYRVRRTRRTQQVFVPMVKRPDPPKLDVRADADQNAFNAEVWLDGQKVGQIPVLLNVSDGRHLVEIKKDGFQPFNQWVEVKEGDRVTVNPALKPIVVAKKGTVLVEADVAEAEVYIDGNRHADVTPTMIPDVVEGPHIIEVRKEPAIPWKQTIQVVAGQTVKVSAELKATIGGPTGTVRVLSNVEGAQVFLDGTAVGTAPVDLKDIAPGDHVIEIKADGHLPREERIKVNAGSSEILKLDLRPEVSTDTGKLKVVSPVPEAAVFIDGERVGNAPQEKEVSAGEHFVVVTKAGFKEFREKVNVEAGQPLTVTADLRAIGELKVLSDPTGAQVLIDGEVAGVTPFTKEDLEAGNHLVTLKLPGYLAYEQSITIKGGGKEIISGRLQEIETGPSAEDLIREQRGLSSFGARALPLGRATLDLAGGYPHYINGQITVGAPEIAGKIPFDAGIMFRTFLSRTELGLKARFTLADRKPFSAGIFAVVGGGSTLFDDSGRNSFFLDAGGLASLTAPGNITVTGRVYIGIWSDRHCPAPDDAAAADPAEICSEAGQMEVGQPRLAELGFDSVEDLTDRESGVRLMISIIAELAFKQHWSAWLLFEGAPFQDERAAFTNHFNGAIPSDQDILTYVRAGVTYKF
ncbi:MAG: PEGA domain-containing protein [Proteobacteria bacterium]|nr:PEGA domain-containing protein [Pseudomonadota bacterium]